MTIRWISDVHVSYHRRKLRKLAIVTVWQTISRHDDKQLSIGDLIYSNRNTKSSQKPIRLTKDRSLHAEEFEQVCDQPRWLAIFATWREEWKNHVTDMPLVSWACNCFWQMTFEKANCLEVQPKINLKTTDIAAQHEIVTASENRCCGNRVFRRIRKCFPGCVSAKMQTLQGG